MKKSYYKYTVISDNVSKNEIEDINFKKSNENIVDN